MTSFSFSTVPTILSAPGATKELGQELRLRYPNIRRVLLVTDQGFLRTGLTEAPLESLKAAMFHVKQFADVLADPPEHIIQEALAAAREHQTELVIGLGGGSSMDVAKLVAVLTASSQSLAEIYGIGNARGTRLPLIQIPTTAGTGSEVTPVAVVSDSSRTLKVGISSPYMIPAAAICDPMLTWTCPPKLTAIAGADAMTHAIEAFTAFRRVPDAALAQQHVFVGKNGFSDLFALRAITLIGRSLEKAYARGNDRQARSDVMQGALAAGCAFGAAGTSLAHAVQYPIGALTHTAHGTGVAALLPYAMSYNRAAATAEMAEVAIALGADSARHSREELSHIAIREVARLFAAIGIPADLKTLGLPEDKIGWTAESAVAIGRLIKNNPRPIDLDGMQHFLNAAYRGDLAAAAQ